MRFADSQGNLYSENGERLGKWPRRDLRSLVLLLGAVAFALLPLLVAVGCASTPADRVAYATIDSATEAVQTSMRVFNDLYQQGKFTKADRTKVIKAYEDFRVVALAAANVSPTLTAEHKSATEKVSAAAVELLRLVEHFTKPKSARASPPVLTFRTEVLAWS